MEEHTRQRDKLMYPRLLIEVSMNQQFPNRISFLDEFDDEIDLEVHYEWLLVLCKNCSGLGHTTEKFRNKDKPKQDWVP